MNRFNFKNRIVPLLLGFSLFFVQAADKDALEKQLNVTTAQAAGKNDRITRSGPEREFVTKTENLFVKTTGFMGQESGPPSHESHEQIGGGFKFIKKNPQRALKKNNTQIKERYDVIKIFAGSDDITYIHKPASKNQELNYDSN